MFLCFSASGQSDSLSDIKDVSIETKYRPKLVDAVKINPTPLMLSPKADAVSYNYKVPDVSFEVQPVYRIVDPVFLKVSESPEVYGNFLKVGFGNYFTPYLKFHLHDHNNKYYDYGVSLEHLSSNASNPEFANFSDNTIRVFGSKRKGSSLLKGSIAYNRNTLHYYGANEEGSDFTADSLNQILNSTASRLTWETKMARNLKFRSEINYGYFSTLTKAEHDVYLKTGLIGKNSQGSWALPLKVNFTTANRPDSNTYNRIVFTLNPNYQFKYEKYRIKVGLLGGYFVDSISEKSQLFVAPDLNAQFFIVPKKMKAFLSVSSSYLPHTYQSLFRRNPFIGDLVDLRNEFTPVDLQTGIKGQLKGTIDYGLSIQYKSVQNMALFRMDSSDLRRFEVLYDDVNTFTFHSEVGVNIKQMISLKGGFNWYNYTMSDELQWNLPSYDLNLDLDARLKDKVYLNLRLYGMGPRIANNSDLGTSENLKPFYDLNASVDYRYKENISFFVNVNNIIGGRYQRWYQYPVYGLNALVGLTATL
jgi:hypothetical protein